tara:strand:+ start:638 stop:1549 length:912 start_codon:yes stop_codon:yes gene_type:complete
MKNKRTAIIDGDIVVYRAGFASQTYIHKIVDQEGDVLEEFSSKAEANDFVEMLSLQEDVTPQIVSETLPASQDDVDMIVDTMIKNIVVNSKSTDYIVYLTGSTNFRNEVATLKVYKGNRADSVRPVHYSYIREYIADKHPTITSDNCEADDLCAMRLYDEFKKAQASKRKSDCEAILCSIDKDLRNIPGHHYNIKSKVSDWVSPKEANRHFALQLLTGDGTDNIPGISFLSDGVKKVGPKTAEKMIGEATTIEELYQAVITVYQEFVVSDWESKLQEVGSLLWMQRAPEEVFSIQDWAIKLYE